MGRPGWSQGKASVGPGEFQSSDAPAMYPRRPCDVPAMSPRFTRTECFLRFGPPHPALTHSLNQRRSKGVWAVTGTRMNTNYTWILSGGFVGQHTWGIRGCGRSKKVLPKYTRHYNHWISSMRTRHFRMTHTASRRIRSTPASAGSPTGGVHQRAGRLKAPPNNSHP